MCVYSVNVYPDSIMLQEGDWYRDVYAIVDAENNYLMDVDWYSDAPDVASVNVSNGYIYGRSPGTARIYARSKTDKSKSDYITVTVTNEPICVSSVSLNKKNILIDKGEKLTLTATICPENATNKMISWHSSDPDIVAVNDGVITAVSRGFACVYAEAQDGSDKYDKCHISVIEEIPGMPVTFNYQDSNEKFE